MKNPSHIFKQLSLALVASTALIACGKAPEPQNTSTDTRSNPSTITGQSVGIAPGRNKEWPNRVIPYTVEPVPNGSPAYQALWRNVVAQAVNLWNSQDTAVKYVPKSPDPNKDKDYTAFVPKGNDPDGNSDSNVGVQMGGGRQDIRMAQATYLEDFTNYARSTFMHEMGHNAGLYHEYSRCDAGNYIINPNIAPNCDTIRDLTAFDYNSIMLYGLSAKDTDLPYFGNPVFVGYGVLKTSLSYADLYGLKMIYGLASQTPQSPSLAITNITYTPSTNGNFTATANISWAGATNFPATAYTLFKDDGTSVSLSGNTTTIKATMTLNQVKIIKARICASSSSAGQFCSGRISVQFDLRDPVTGGNGNY
jgi:hypothetical protein